MVFCMVVYDVDHSRDSPQLSPLFFTLVWLCGVWGIASLRADISQKLMSGINAERCAFMSRNHQGEPSLRDAGPEVRTLMGK